MSQTIDDVFGDYNTAGVPASGDKKPSKPAIRALLKQIQNSGGLAITRNTYTALAAVTPPTEFYMGVVLDDSDVTKNGYYSRVSAAWVRERGFPDTFARLTLSGSGTAQTATVSAGVNPADIEVFFARVITPNTGPMTLSVAGATSRAVVNIAGNALSAGEWTGGVMFFLNDSNQYQLINDAGAALSAATSASGAAASLASFNLRYIGAYASNTAATTAAGTPTVGQLYWNTATNELRSWNGSAWGEARGGITWLGNYSGATAYVLDDAVLYNGSTWRSLGATTGNTPPTLPTTSNAYWELLARQGIDGAGTVASVVAGTGIDVDVTDPTAPVVSLDPDALVPPRGHLAGLTLTNNAVDTEHDLDIAVGEASSDATTAMRMILSTGITKRFDATFVAGTGNGGFASGEAIPTSGTIHIWLIAKADGTVDVFANNHASSGLSPALPATFTHKRRIASWTTDASANLDQIVQNGNFFGRKSPANSINVTDPGTAAVLRALSVPLGIRVMARLSIYVEESTAPGNNGVLVSDPAATDVAPSLAAFSIYGSILGSGVASGTLDVMTDTSAQVRVRQSRSNANIAMRGTTIGWFDPLDRSFAGGSTSTAGMPSVFDYGAAGDGVTDDSAAFTACQVANPTFRVPKATYALNSPVTILTGKTWICENATFVHDDPTEKILQTTETGNWSILGKLTLVGLGTDAASATDDGEIGLYIDSAQNYRVESLRVDQFDGRGVMVTGAVSGTYHGDAGVFQHLSGTANWLALDVPAVSGGGSQYTIFNNLQLVGNRQAARITAGNCSLGGGNIVMNEYGLELSDGPNDGHGTATALHINHNVQWNIYASDVLLGFTFIGCHVFGDSASLGKIILTDCAGINFDGGTFDCAVENNGATYMNVLRNGFFPGTYFSVGGTHPAKIAVSGYTPTAVWV